MQTLEENQLLQILHGRTGHFCTESGFHSDYWLDTNFLFSKPEQLAPVVSKLGELVMAHSIDLVCGPMDGGAKIAEMISQEYELPYIYSERQVEKSELTGKITASYTIPENMQKQVKDKRIALIDDIINAGSAVKATFSELKRLGGLPAVLGSLAVKGELIYPFATENKLPIETITKISTNMWQPADCPLCAGGVLLESVI